MQYEIDLEAAQCILYPTDKIKYMWDIYILFLLIWTATILPFTTAFHSYRNHPELVPIDFVIDLSFLIDIIFTFFTSIKNEKTGRFEFRKQFIAIKYFKTWFIPDVIINIPWSLIEYGIRNDSSRGSNGI